MLYSVLGVVLLLWRKRRPWYCADLGCDPWVLPLSINGCCGVWSSLAKATGAEAMDAIFAQQMADYECRRRRRIASTQPAVSWR